MKWKANWDESRQRFCDWWERKGLLVGMWWPPSGSVCHDPHATPVEEAQEEVYKNPILRARQNHWALAHQAFPLDILPLSVTDLGPGSLALCLGSEPGFAPHTIWFTAPFEHVKEPESLPAFAFDPENRWFRLHAETARASRDLAGENYLVAIPDLVENVDVLASLREPQRLLVDMIERPEWVKKSLVEITDAWFDVYGRLYDIVRDSEGGSAFGAFRVWGPGKAAKLQCDASVMFSPDMFREFVVPELTRQCEWLDQSIYHLDGTQAIMHLDALLEIKALDAIEWTSQAGVEHGAHERWFPMFKKILNAGKSIQVIAYDPSSGKDLL
ncbi:MAG: cobalamin-binding protein, partial [Planctomycetes bacterium]|nr:cobalamin-binding protein [Planctomycetota bacterium]